MLALKLGESLSSNNSSVINGNAYSLAFNGSDESVNVDDVGGDVNVDAGTVSLWVKINTTSASGHMFHMRVDANNLINIFYHAFSNEGRATYKAGGSAKVASFTDAIENDGKWHNIVATWDTPADELKLYLDGTLKDTVTGLGTWAGSIGLASVAQSTQDAGFFNGNITEVAVFTRVVPIGELWIAKRQPINLTGSTGLVGYWKFDEGSGTTAGDSSGKGNAGELVNTPTWSTDVPYKTG